MVERFSVVITDDTKPLREEILRVSTGFVLNYAWSSGLCFRGRQHL